MTKTRSSILFFLILSLSQNIFAFRGFNTKVTFCNDASSIVAADVIISGEDGMYGSVEYTQPGQCTEKMIPLPNLIKVVVYFGYNNVAKYTGLENAIKLKIMHKNYRQQNGLLGETTELVRV